MARAGGENKTDMKSEKTTTEKVAWFCLRSQPKHEHIATAHLRQQPDVDVFFPRIRFQRTTRTGVVWVTEALFPNYLFARFNWNHSLRAIHHSPGVSAVVHFGLDWPVIPDEAIAQLRARLGENELHVIPAEVLPGDTVRIAGGCLHGLEAIVTQIMPGGKRVAVLLDFLGRQSSLKLDITMVVKEADDRRLIAQMPPR
jgi:transcriptional antiterminator RfaH